uniref:Uncharacterized protein n=1 Tax=Glossina austeni TaxID=7395 RepID=A0A1A9URA4_GLOAU
MSLEYRGKRVTEMYRREVDDNQPTSPLTIRSFPPQADVHTVRSSHFPRRPVLSGSLYLGWVHIHTVTLKVVCFLKGVLKEMTIIKYKMITYIIVIEIAIVLLLVIQSRSSSSSLSSSLPSS